MRSLSSRLVTTSTRNGAASRRAKRPGLGLGMGGALLVALAVAYLHDLVHVLKGQLRPRHESALYWRVLYSWLALGLPVGFTAASPSW